MNVPGDLKYTTSHEWVRQESDGSVTIGITDFAQDALGDLVFVEVPEVGRTLKAREACAVVESVKAASDVYAPIAGEVVASNEQLKDKPEAINEDAFNAWIFKIKPANAADIASLMNAEAYKQNIAAQS